MVSWVSQAASNGAVLKRDECWESAFGRELSGRCRLGGERLNAAVFGPREISFAFARASERHVFAWTDLTFRSGSRLDQEDVTVTAPRGGELSIFDYESTTVHRAGIQFPGAFAELGRLGEVRSVYRACDVEVARAVDYIAPHCVDASASVDSQGRMAALADRAFGRRVDRDVLRPCHASVGGLRSIKLSALGAQIEPCGEERSIRGGGHCMETFAGGSGNVVDDSGTSPSLAAVE